MPDFTVMPESRPPVPHDMFQIQIHPLASPTFTSSATFITIMAMLGVLLGSPPSASAEATETSDIEAQANESRAEILHLLSPWFDEGDADELRRSAMMEVALERDMRRIFDAREDRPRGFELAMPTFEMPLKTTRLLHRQLVEAGNDSALRNRLLAAILLARHTDGAGRLLALRSLGTELARLRGEPADRLVNTAISVFALNHATELTETDPRHRIPLLEALFEIRDFAGMIRATRGYEGHQLQSLIENYADVARRQMPRWDAPHAEDVAAVDPGDETLGVTYFTRGMYRGPGGGWTWLEPPSAD